MTIGPMRVGTVGAGMMGAEIALSFALAGHEVRLHDSDPASVERAMARLGEVLDKGAARGFYKAEDRQATLDRLLPTPDLAAFADREFVIEAVFEDVAVKSDVFRRLDAICAPDCLLASNTSTIPISTLAAALSAERRSRFLGTHFFSPVSRMKLVEVIPGFETAPDVVDRVMEICRTAAKEPIRVKDVAGFAVNRVLHAFLIEAVRLAEEEVATPEDIDKACRLGLGHPVGPFELMDLVTNGLTLQVQEILHDAYGPRFLPRPLLKQRVAAGHQGRRTGRGWKAYGR